MKYFNVVLKPPADLSQQLVLFAQENFADKADGYCLSDTVLPHITLCQFKANEAPEVSFGNVQKVPEPTVYQLRAGKEIHEGYLWAEILIKPEPWLNDLHCRVRDELISHGAEILTKDYMPHQTFCRLSESQKDLAMAIQIPDMLLQKHEGWTFEVGHCDVNGQYLGNAL